MLNEQLPSAAWFVGFPLNFSKLLAKLCTFSLLSYYSHTVTKLISIICNLYILLLIT